MPSRPSPPRALLYSVFYRLPLPVRRRLVRLAVPKYIVGGVVLVTDSDATDPGRLLLLRQPPNRGWSLPAGLLQRGEAPVVGAARELWEETGIRLPPDRLAPAVPNAVVHAKGWVDMVFTARVPASRTELVVDGAEVFEAAWHPLDGLPRLSGPTARLLAHYGIGPLAGDRPAGPEAIRRAGERPAGPEAIRRAGERPAGAAGPAGPGSVEPEPTAPESSR